MSQYKILYGKTANVSVLRPAQPHRPEVDQYMAKSDSYQSDKTPSSGDLDIPGTST